MRIYCKKIIKHPKEYYSKHVKLVEKNLAVPCFFNSILNVSKSDETPFLVFDT